jgi:hypothetical protein
MEKEPMKPSLCRSLLFLMSVTVCGPLSAATFTVTRTNISGPGSLPAAIAQANATPEDNTIEFSVTGTIWPSAPLPMVTNNLTINGAGIAISGGGAIPLFTFAAGTTSSLSGLVIVGAYAASGNGAAVSNAGTLFISNCVLTNNNASSGSGGAVFNLGNLTLDSSVVSGNCSSNGGAIGNGGIMTLSRSVLNGNSATNGGAIFNSGAASLVDMVVSSNSARIGFGGGIYNQAQLSINQSTFNNNMAVGGNGQSVYVNGPAGAGGGGGGGGIGGGIFEESGTVGITNCTFYSNSTVGGVGGDNTGGGTVAAYGGGYNGGGGTHPEGGFGGGGGSGGLGGLGGGSGGDSGSASAPYCTYGQIAYGGPLGGGQGGYGYAVQCGSMGGPGGGGAALGGALFVKGGNLALIDCTLTANSCTGGACGFDWHTQSRSYHPGLGIGGAILNYAGQVVLVNTLVAQNLGDDSPDLWGAFITSGFNLIGNNQGATNLSVFDYQNELPNLGSFQDNGGSTWTCVPLPGSLAIGGGTTTGAPMTDQRGVPRPQAGAYDIGAVQTVTTSPLSSYSIGPSGFSLSTILDSATAYQVQVSSNLTTWLMLTNYANGGSHRYSDLISPTQPQRFYRAVVR